MPQSPKTGTQLNILLWLDVIFH